MILLQRLTKLIEGKTEGEGIADKRTSKRMTPTTSSADSAVELHGIAKDYQIANQRVHALREVSLRVVRGSRVAIMGKSGAGKSTLLHVIGTLERPTRGVLKINGQDVSKIDDVTASAFRNVTIGFVFQASNLLPEFSALENVMMPGLIKGMAHRTIQQRAALMLQRVGLQKRQHHRPSELSGGEKQRVAIARALVMTPTLILADEPTGNLDKGTGIQVRDLLFALCSEHNATLLLVTHDPELANDFDQRIFMEDGKIIEHL